MNRVKPPARRESSIARTGVWALRRAGTGDPAPLRWHRTIPGAARVRGRFVRWHRMIPGARSGSRCVRRTDRVASARNTRWHRREGRDGAVRRARGRVSCDGIGSGGRPRPDRRATGATGRFGWPGAGRDGIGGKGARGATGASGGYGSQRGSLPSGESWRRPRPSMPTSQMPIERAGSDSGTRTKTTAEPPGAKLGWRSRRPGVFVRRMPEIRD